MVVKWAIFSWFWSGKGIILIENLLILTGVYPGLSREEQVTAPLRFLVVITELLLGVITHRLLEPLVQETRFDLHLC